MRHMLARRPGCGILAVLTLGAHPESARLREWASCSPPTPRSGNYSLQKNAKSGEGRKLGFNPISLVGSNDGEAQTSRMALEGLQGERPQPILTLCSRWAREEDVQEDL